MIQIGNTLLSLDIVEKEFVCNIKKCKGICCVEGDSGAPILDSEIEIIKQHYDAILSFVSPTNKAVLEENGPFYIDHEGEKVTTLVNNVECAFIVEENGIYSCAIERAYEQGLIPIPKPISCHLYPIRCRQYQEFEALNYDTWHICKDAVCLGKQKKVKIYEFLKVPLLRKYGENWYNELSAIAQDWNKNKQQS